MGRKNRNAQHERKEKERKPKVKLRSGIRKNEGVSHNKHKGSRHHGEYDYFDADLTNMEEL